MGRATSNFYQSQVLREHLLLNQGENYQHFSFFFDSEDFLNHNYKLILNLKSYFYHTDFLGASKRLHELVFLFDLIHFGWITPTFYFFPFCNSFILFYDVFMWFFLYNFYLFMFYLMPVRQLISNLSTTAP